MSRPVNPKASLEQRICKECAVEVVRDPVAEVAEWFVTRPTVPPELSTTHEVCAACASLIAIGQDHESRCLFRCQRLELSTLGWTSALSEALRSDLRRGTDLAFRLSTRLVSHVIRQLLSSGRTESPLIVPIPTSGTRDAVMELGQMVAADLELPLLRAITRVKTRSTRDSGAVRRAAIAREEYSAHLSARGVEGRSAILFDDVVTTGNTMAAVARILFESGASQVYPVSIDRTVSARVLQRVPNRAQDTCPHIASTLRDAGRM